MIGDQLHQLVLVHHGGNLFRQLVHVAVTALQAERRFGTVAIILCGTGDVLLVDSENYVPGLHQALQGGGNLVDLGGAVIMAQLVAGEGLAFRLVDEAVEILHVPGGQRGEHRIGGQAVLDIAEGEHLLHAPEGIAQVVDVRPVGQHVRNPEYLAGLGIGVAGHDHTELAAAHVIGAGAPLPYPFDTPGAIAQGDELLQELRMGVLDVVHIQHDVVAHLQRQVELDQLLGRGRVGRLLRVQRAYLVPQRRAVDLHEHQAEAVGNILHQGGLAVTGG